MATEQFVSNEAVAILGATGILITSIVGAVTIYLKTRSAISREASDAMLVAEQKRDRSALGPLREALKMEREENQRKNAHIRELSDGYDQLYEEMVALRVESAENRTWMEQMHRLAVKLARMAKLDPEAEVPPLPPRRPRTDAGQEFRTRTLKQNTQLLQPPPPPPGSVQP